MKILGTGLNGLVGSRITELLGSQYRFENVSRSTGVDITNLEQVENAVKSSNAEVILHLAAKANVDLCEEDKDKGEQGEAWQINVLGTKNIIQAAEKFHKKILYISTDFVFDGNKEFYTEEDIPRPINWYGKTKAEAEKLVQNSQESWIIVRPAFPYRATGEKLDFVRAIKSRLDLGLPIKGIADNLITPTFIDDFAQALDVLITKNATGIYHVVGESSLSSYEAAKEIAKTFGLDQTLVSETTNEIYFAGKAPRPLHLVIKNDKIKTLGVKAKSFSEGLSAIKKQLQ